MNTTTTTGVIAIVETRGGSACAVRFPNMMALHKWEDAHPEVEVISSMALVSRNYAEQVAR